MAHGQRPAKAGVIASRRTRPRLVTLATASPRRHALFRAFGLPHRIIVPRVAEVHDPRLAPVDVVKHNALLKARAVARRTTTGVIVAADTLVVCGGRLFGKPRNRADAKRMLRSLSGRTHHVYTGVCVLDLDRQRTSLDVAVTAVTIRRLSTFAIKRYLRESVHHDKAGAYAIQDTHGMLIDRLHGSLSNVVGLPLHVLERRLRDCGFPV